MKEASFMPSPHGVSRAVNGVNDVNSLDLSSRCKETPIVDFYLPPNVQFSPRIFNPKKVTTIIGYIIGYIDHYVKHALMFPLKSIIIFFID